METGCCTDPELVERLKTLHEQGLEAERDDDHQEAERIFQESVLLAGQQGNQLVADHLRWHLAAVFFRQNRYRRCVAELMPLIREQSPYPDDLEDSLCGGITGGDLRMVALFEFCMAAMILPARWESIGACLEMLRAATSRLDRSQETTRNLVACYWLARVNFLERSGRHGQALLEAKRALGTVHPVHRSHFLGWGALMAAELGEERQCEGFLRKLGQLGQQGNFHAELARVVTARKLGDAGRAHRLASDLGFTLWGHSRLDHEFRGLVQEVECALAAGELTGALDRLRTLRARHDRELRLQRYDLLRLTAEYHLARARALAGLPPRDCRYDESVEEPPACCDPTPQARREAGLAAVGLRRARRLAARIERESGLTLQAAAGQRAGEVERLRERFDSALVQDAADGGKSWLYQRAG